MIVELVAVDGHVVDAAHGQADAAADPRADAVAERVIRETGAGAWKCDGRVHAVAFSGHEGLQLLETACSLALLSLSIDSPKLTESTHFWMSVADPPNKRFLR